jgi:hypothetical protein
MAEQNFPQPAAGWGKPAQPHTGEDDKDIRVTIRRRSMTLGLYYSLF